MNVYLVQFTSRLDMDEGNRWQTWAYHVWALSEVMAADLAYDRAMEAGMDPMLEPSWRVDFVRKPVPGEPTTPAVRIARPEPQRRLVDKAMDAIERWRERVKASVAA